MKKHLLILLPLFLFTTKAFSQEKKETGTINVVKYKYAIDFPEKPEHDTKNVTTDIGKLLVDYYIHAPNTPVAPNFVYMTLCTVYPKKLTEHLDKEGTGSFYKSAIDGGVQKVEGTLLDTKTIKLGKIEGREARILMKDKKAIVRMRVFLVENRMYLNQTIASKEKDGNPTAIKFLDSFRLLP